MMMFPASPLTPARQVMNTMQNADPRLLRLVRALAFAFIAMSLVVAAMGCSTQLQIVNGGLDQATLLLFAMLPVLYFSGLKRS